MSLIPGSAQDIRAHPLQEDEVRTAHRTVSDGFFIAGPDGNSIALIQRCRPGDSESKEELGVPNNENRSPLIDERRSLRRRQKLPFK